MNLRYWFCFLRSPDRRRARAPSAVRAGECVVVPDTCCEAAPRFRDSAYSSILGIRSRWRPSGTTRPARPGRPTSCVSWTCSTRPPIALTQQSQPEQLERSKYSAAGWTTDSLGLVFGLTLDRYGNIYVTHTSCFNYGPDNVGIGGAGAIYRIDAVTGYVTVFAVLPNTYDTSISPPDGFPGLGNITYDCDHNQFFVTDEDDGKIYRLRSTNPNNASPATLLSTFDHGVADTGTPGWAPLGERLWAVQWHGNRIYYGIWVRMDSPPTPSQRDLSVALGAGGAFIPISDQKESPCADDGIHLLESTLGHQLRRRRRMLIGERGMYGPTNSYLTARGRSSTAARPVREGTSGCRRGTSSTSGSLALAALQRRRALTTTAALACVEHRRLSELPVLRLRHSRHGHLGRQPLDQPAHRLQRRSRLHKTQVGDVEVPCADTSHGEIHGRSSTIRTTTA